MWWGPFGCDSPILGQIQITSHCCQLKQGVCQPVLDTPPNQVWLTLNCAQALYPVTNLMRSVALRAPPPAQEGGLFRRERLRVRLSYAEARGGGGGLNRLHMVMELPRPGWGVLNVTGPVVGWSFAAEVPGVRNLWAFPS